MKLKPHARFSNLVSHAYVLLSEYCPLDCQYCYVKNRRVDNEVSIDDVDTLINRFQHPQPRLIFFGGEPLWKYKLIAEVMQRYGDRCRYQIVTSAMVHWVAAKETLLRGQLGPLDLQVSWDGYGANNRLTRAGTDIDDTPLTRAIGLAREGIQVELRTVVNDNNVISLPHTARLAGQLNQKYPCLTWDFTIAHQPRFEPDFALHLESSLTALLTEGVYIPRFLKQRMASVLADSQISSCDAGSYVVMRPDGSLHACTMLAQTAPSLCMGHVSKVKLDWEPVTLLKQVAKVSDCVDCEYRSVCDGGCRYERHATFGGAWCSRIHQHTCEIAKAFHRAITGHLSRMSEAAATRTDTALLQSSIWDAYYSAGMHVEASKASISNPRRDS